MEYTPMDFMRWYKQKYQPQAWTELQVAIEKQGEARINTVDVLVKKTDAKLQQAKKRLRAATKALADCQTQLIYENAKLVYAK